MKSLPAGVRIWLLALLGCGAMIYLSFPHFDLVLADYLFPVSRHVKGLEENLGSPALLSLEAATIVLLTVIRLLRGRLPRFGKALALACTTSICAFAINATILKAGFGVPTPKHVMHGAEHAFHWFSGSEKSSFPSGHMVLAAAFAGVLMRLYRASIWPLAGFLAVAAALLLVGEWHFLSDVIAGTFIGISAGLAVGNVRAIRVWAANSPEEGVPGRK